MNPWPSDAQRDRLIGDWHIYQRKGGHRTGTDDVVLAWFATKHFERTPNAYLDLGCGVASVLLMTAHQLSASKRLPISVFGVEAQEQSTMLAQRAIDDIDKLSVELHHCDFRDFQTEQRFDLITGSPPYFPLNTGVHPKDPQRLACRFETRGGVEAYCETASRLLTADGSFYLVHQSTCEERVLAAAKEADLFLHGRVDFAMKEKQPAFLSVFAFSKRSDVAITKRRLAVRQNDGEFTPEFHALRHELGVE